MEEHAELLPAPPYIRGGAQGKNIGQLEVLEGLEKKDKANERRKRRLDIRE